MKVIIKLIKGGAFAFDVEETTTVIYCSNEYNSIKIATVK